MTEICREYKQKGNCNAKTPLPERGVSTLLIPDNLFDKYSKKLISHKGKREYFSYLLKRYRVLLEFYILNPGGLKTIYQSENQNLKKINFRPLSEDWAELSIFSCSAGRSRCLIFTILLLMDLQNWGSLLKRIGIRFNHPYNSHKKWELQSSLGFSREESFFSRGFYPKRM